MAKHYENPSELCDMGKCPLIAHNNNIIENIHIDDLNYLEKDLEYSDKVSLIFLLYGGSPLKAKHGLQTLLVAYQSPTTHTTFIQKWAQSEIQSKSNWRLVLIEALWTIKSKYVLQKLGLDVQDLHARFLNPENAAFNLFIHPILKGLYCIVCEKLHPAEAKELIKYVSRKNHCGFKINFNDEKYLEVFLLNWLSELVIEAGEWPSSSEKRNIFCNVNQILDCLKLHLHKPDLANELQEIVVRFNFTLQNVTKIEKKKNVTDDGIENEGDKVTKQTLSRRDSNSDVEQNWSDDKYVVERNTAGSVLIINQIKFYRDQVRKANLPKKRLEERHGSDKDAKALKRTFSAFGYHIEKENLTDLEIVQEIESVVSRSAKSDSLIVCILSHGLDGVIYGSNSVPLKIKDIQDKIVAKQLLNKPKILILQSCQGEETQIAEPIKSLTDSNHLVHDGPNETIPMRSDFCVAKSTISGFASFRHKQQGSWFIQHLCAVINEYSDKKHFLDIMTIVKRRVTELRGDRSECMVPICKDTFTKDFYFPQTIVVKK